jgi:hypothetical protein
MGHSHKVSHTFGDGHWRHREGAYAHLSRHAQSQVSTTKWSTEHKNSIKISLQHVSDHCRVVRSIQSQVYRGRMHSVETGSLILSTNRNV